MWSWATRYLDFGWNIFPIEAAGKKPRVKWEEYQITRVTSDHIDKWWHAWPYANIALICGHISGVVVLDVDAPEQCESLIVSVPETAISKTSRGKHFFFKYPPGHTIPPSFRGKGFDFQSDGKYVILPPSEHSSGVFYEWLINPWALIEPFAELPIELYNTAQMYSGGGSGGFTPITNMDGYFQGAKEGERHNAAVRLCGYLIKNGREYDEVLCTMFGWNLKNVSPLPTKEVKTIVDTLFQSDARRKNR